MAAASVSPAVRADQRVFFSFACKGGRERVESIVLVFRDIGAQFLVCPLRASNELTPHSFTCRGAEIKTATKLSATVEQVKELTIRRKLVGGDNERDIELKPPSQWHVEADYQIQVVIESKVDQGAAAAASVEAPQLIFSARFVEMKGSERGEIVEVPKPAEMTNESIGKHTRREFTTGINTDYIRAFGSIVVDLFFDETGALRQQFAKDIPCKETYAKWGKHVKDDLFPQAESLQRQDVGAAQYELIVSALLKISDEELGEMMLCMGELENNRDYGTRSNWVRPIYATSHINNYRRYLNYPYATLDTSVKMDPPIGDIEKLYPLPMVQTLRRHGIKIDNLSLHYLEKATRHIEISALDHFAMRFQDGGRAGVAFKIIAERFWASSSGVLVLYQSFADISDKWEYSICGSIKTTVQEYRRRGPSLRDLSLGSFSFGSAYDYVVLSNLLAGKDPICRISC